METSFLDPPGGAAAVPPRLDLRKDFPDCRDLPNRDRASFQWAECQRVCCPLAETARRVRHTHKPMKPLVPTRALNPMEMAAGDEVEIIQPKVIIALGRAVVNALFSEDEARKFGALRGNWKTFEGVPVMVTFNPAYLLQNDTLKTKRMAWEDLLQVMEKLDLPISEKQRAFFLPKQ